MQAKGEKERERVSVWRAHSKSQGIGALIIIIQSAKSAAERARAVSINSPALFVRLFLLSFVAPQSMARPSDGKVNGVGQSEKRMAFLISELHAKRAALSLSQALVIGR